MAKHTSPYRLRKHENGYYYVKLDGGPYKSLGTKNPTEARRLAREAWEQKATATPESQMTLGELLAPYYGPDCPHVSRRLAEGKSIGAQHIKNSRAFLEKYIFPDPICKVKLEALRRDDVLKFRDRLVKAGIGRKAQQIFSVLKACIGNLYYREILTKNPVEKVAVPRYATQPREAFTREELVRLFRHSPGYFERRELYAVFYLAATTGMRRGEILALQWKDLNDNLLTIQRAFKNVDAAVVGLPKWNKTRQVALTPRAVAILADLRQRDHSTSPGDFVFCHPDGQPYGSEMWDKGFNRAITNAGIEKKNRTAHSLRHSVATQMNSSGAPLGVILAMLGWSSDKMLGNYSHIGGAEALPWIQGLEL